jgi:hypothetical protein
MDVEFWKAIFDWLVLIFIVLSVFTGAGALITGKIISDRQEAKSRQFDSDLTTAKIELGRQQERAAKAEGVIALAGQHAAEAKAKAEGFRLDIAGANERAGKAEEKAADAIKTAETERLARVRIEEKLAGWRFSAEAQTRIITRLKPYEKTPFDLGTDPGEIVFLETIDSLLGSAGWTRQQPKSDNPLFSLLVDGKARINYVSGIHVEIASSSWDRFRPAVEALVRVLRDEGIPAQGELSPEEKDPSCIHIVIGKK